MEPEADMRAFSELDSQSGKLPVIILSAPKVSASLSGMDFS
jgi:hypothetical protein